MTSPLYVIALVSGGKDSLFSILHCRANGHSVVALANLHPMPSADDEDMNSYMYQTVGHATIPLYEHALGVPLYRQEIAGRTVNTSRDYEASLAGQLDETENLMPLLSSVMEAHPKANAVSTGAILSTYQRTRVESVALRLGLTPLSYLWQYPILPPYTQSSLLHDMAVVGQEAIIIKTASGGLNETFLGSNLASQTTIGRLRKAMARFGDESNGAILGEGGEFETLAIDGPRPLWKMKIHVDVGRSESIPGGQAVLKILGTTLEEKSGTTDGPFKSPRIPSLFDDEFKMVCRTFEGHDYSQCFTLDNATLVNVSFQSVTLISEKLPRNASSDTPTVFTYSNLASDARLSSNNGSCAAQLSKILLRLEHTLTQWNVDKAGINHCTLLLRDMADFTILNPIYGNYFNYVNPPARVTIAVGEALPEGVDVMLSIVVDRSRKDRKGKIIKAVQREGLHVQGRSYWAPANIGPYSQAISVRLPLVDEKTQGTGKDGGEIVYVAGQIPLVPASMEVYQAQGFKGQAVLSLQHLWRIGRAKGVKWWSAAVVFIPLGDNADEQVCIAQDAWKAVHSLASPQQDENDNDEADIDPWDRMNGVTGLISNDATYRSPIPDPSAISSPTTLDKSPIPPCFIAQVHSLPRGVDIEWSATGLTGCPITFTRSLAHDRLTMTAPTHSRTTFYTLEIREQDDIDILRRLGENSVREWTSATLYAGPGFEWNAKMGLRGVQWVPCFGVWGEGGREVRAVLVGRVDRDDELEESVMGKFLRRVSGS